MQDVFKYDMAVKNEELPTSTFAVLDLGEGAIQLLQQMDITYGRQLNQFFPVGEAAVYYVSGNPSGTLRVGLAVGKTGFMKPFMRSAEMCGTLTPINVTLSGSRCDLAIENKSMKFTGAILESLNFSVNGQNLILNQGAQYRLAGMTVSN